MILLILFAFLGGVITILSPCILPILPIVLSGSVVKDKYRPIGIIFGFVLSFTFFTLFLSAIVRSTGLSADVLRTISIFVLAGFGLSLLIPKIQLLFEKLFSKLANKANIKKEQGGLFGGVVIGMSLGLLWTPCVGPILASIITLAAASTVTFSAFLITLAYSVGTAIPMLAIMAGGRQLLTRIPWLTSNTTRIQKSFGVIMILLAIAINFNLDRQFQTYILDKFPNYGVGLTKLEDNQLVKNELINLKSGKSNALPDLKESLYSAAPEIIPGGRWFNSQPMTLSELKGKVVLIDFWTYTCINCIRTLPYLRNWHEKYKDKGLVIIGVHTPEFEFEKNPENVANAIKDFRLTYPIVQDNDYETWNAYNNHYWPAKYFIDKNGKIRSTHFGEGEYDESERIIQNLLKETGNLTENISITNPEYSIDSRTPEIYLGYLRISGFSSNEDIKRDEKNTYSSPRTLGFNKFSFSGVWTVTGEYSLPEKGGVLELNYQSKNVFLVMGSKNNLPGMVKVYLDNKFIKEIEVNNYQLYEIIKLEKPGIHFLRLEFQDSNLELFAFTFG